MHQGSLEPTHADMLDHCPQFTILSCSLWGAVPAWCQLRYSHWLTEGGGGGVEKKEKRKGNTSEVAAKLLEEAYGRPLPLVKAL